jgi:hypothetical protein
MILLRGKNDVSINVTWDCLHKGDMKICSQSKYDFSQVNKSSYLPYARVMNVYCSLKILVCSHSTLSCSLNILFWRPLSVCPSFQC